MLLTLVSLLPLALLNSAELTSSRMSELLAHKYGTPEGCNPGREPTKYSPWKTREAYYNYDYKRDMREQNHISGIYYFTSMIGLDPMANWWSVDIYDDYFWEIHRRDLELLSKSTKFIRLPGLTFSHLDNENFLNLVEYHCLKVMLTFSLNRYQLTPENIFNEEPRVISEFTKFVERFKDHDAVAMWIVGDEVFDPFVGTLEPGDLTYQKQYFLLLDRLHVIAKGVEKKRNEGALVNQTKPTRPVLFPKMSTAITDPITDLVKYQFVPDNLDGWILNFREIDIEKMFRYLDGPTSSIRKWKDSHPEGLVILQFASSAYVNYKYNLENQTQRMSTILQKYDNLKNNASILSGVIAEEWTDQWWKGDIDELCSSAKMRPFLQSNCSIGYYGFAAQYNKWGAHCIRLRAVLDTWKTFFNYTDPYDNGTQTDYCVYVVPSLFVNIQAVFFYSLLGFVAVLDIFLFIVYYTKRIQKEKRNNKSRTHPGDDESEESEDSYQKSLTEKKMRKDAETQSLKQGEIPETIRFPIGERTYSLKSAKVPPNTNSPVLNSNDALGFYFYEHLHRQKINIDALIKHEEDVLHSLNDLGLFTNVDKALIKREAIKVVHARLLEGYECWLEKVNIKGNKPRYEDLGDSHDYYGEILLFRIMVSISEHIAHCPERLAYMFNKFIRAKEGNHYTIDLDELMLGLETLVQGKINFDDINESAILNRSKIGKTFRETVGFGVIFDYLRDYHDIGFFKFWIYMIAILLHQSDYFFQTFVGAQVKFFQTSHMQEICETESIAYLGVKIFLFFYFIYQQKRISSRRIFRYHYRYSHGRPWQCCVEKS